VVTAVSHCGARSRAHDSSDLSSPVAIRAPTPAIRDTKIAIHSLRKAMYFRLHMDDAALDRK